MAYYNSGALSPGQSFTLGQYTISLTATPDPGEGTTGINVRCDKGAERERVSAEVEGTVESWSVEANNDTADVYVTYKSEFATLKSGAPSAVKDQEFARLTGSGYNRTYYATNAQRPILAGAIYVNNGGYVDPITMDTIDDVAHSNWSTKRTITVNGVLFYADTGGGFQSGTIASGANLGTYADHQEAMRTLALQYFDFHNEETESMPVARFAIDLHDAGGTGPDSDWNDPGDYNEDADPGDPQKTLHLTVTGALSGRHNDPLHDTSYSYIPAPNDAVAGWGNGGNGGHGGGGGAGASTVIVRKFATDKAGHKDIIALAKRHGYGSGGGKGAKGGDGCILIFY